MLFLPPPGSMIPCILVLVAMTSYSSLLLWKYYWNGAMKGKFHWCSCLPYYAGCSPPPPELMFLPLTAGSMFPYASCGSNQYTVKGMFFLWCIVWPLMLLLLSPARTHACFSPHQQVLLFSSCLCLLFMIMKPCCCTFSSKGTSSWWCLCHCFLGVETLLSCNASADDDIIVVVVMDQANQGFFWKIWGKSQLFTVKTSIFKASVASIYLLVQHNWVSVPITEWTLPLIWVIYQWIVSILPCSGWNVQGLQQNSKQYSPQYLTVPCGILTDSSKYVLLKLVIWKPVPCGLSNDSGEYEYL